MRSSGRPGAPAGGRGVPAGGRGAPAVHLNRLGEWPEAVRLETLFRRAVRLALAAAGGATRDAAKGQADGELSVTFLSDGEIRELNRRYLGRDRPTDVLSFDLGEEGALLGDIYISPEAARRAADELGVPVEEELLRLVVHGVLHLLGHDHPEGDKRYDSEMFRLQEEVVGRLERTRRRGGREPMEDAT